MHHQQANAQAAQEAATKKNADDATAFFAKNGTAEGVVTTESAKALAEREGVEMPIVNAVHRVLFEKQPARWALVELMTRDLKGEHE